jgi:hypothetical protein
MNNPFYFLGFPGFPIFEAWGMLWKAVWGMR